MIRLKHSITFLILLIASVTFAQKGDYVHDKGSNWTDKLYFGGGFGLSGDANTAFISLSPIVGYMITNRLSAGVGVTYQYVKSGDFDDNRYGGQLFLRMNLFKGIFLYSSYEFINYATGPTLEGPRNTATRLPLGAGLSQPIGKRSSINFLAAYDVLYNQTDPLRAYSSPWIFSIFFSI